MQLRREVVNWVMRQLGERNVMLSKGYIENLKTIGNSDFEFTKMVEHLNDSHRTNRYSKAQ